MWERGFKALIDDLKNEYLSSTPPWFAPPAKRGLVAASVCETVALDYFPARARKFFNGRLIACQRHDGIQF
ncbi:hypothetical protein ATN84_20080 [Paramesorhizobium deserti]|uniref:Uncharacterized protein n=1 Tax=Paramesorhizobium deserti TaxID=1494590 RepID=A0A135HQS2_9HYPH|nr:hypothetical protein ATN84_20080 [Paramesorhizobium deserti]